MVAKVEIPGVSKMLHLECGLNLSRLSKSLVLIEHDTFSCSPL